MAGGKTPPHGGYRDTTLKSVEDRCLEKVGGKRKKRGGRKTGSTELPCRRGGWKGGWGLGGVAERRRRTLVKLSTDA